MQSYILHMDLDSFFVSVERLFDPSLIGKPVIVGGSGDRGVVSSCSYEARQFGVHSAMSGKRAKQLCPHGIFLRGRMEEYSNYSRRVTEIIADRAPLFEKASIDEFYVDLTGMDRFFGCWDWSVALRKAIIDETKLPISFGLSINKMLAKMATNEGKPNGQFMIAPGTEQAFLDPKPVGKIPFCGEKTEAFLNSKGIRTIYDLRQFSAEAMHHLMGKHGVELWERAHGRGSTTLSPYHDPKSMSSERTFSMDTNDTDWLKKVIMSLTEKLGFELRGEKKLSGCVAVKIRYQDFSTHTKQIAISPTSNTKLLTEKAITMFDEAYQAGRKVRLIGVRLGNLEEGAYQVNMFEDTEKDVQLYKAIDLLKSKHGLEKLTLAQNLGLGNVKRNDPKAELDKEVKRNHNKKKVDK
ncbi:MAG: DNA polymerase IV [Bacteroidetes bacterium]|mgnify:FL=1|nr:DNA polymerase IV [Bacteroidota bacterium]